MKRSILFLTLLLVGCGTTDLTQSQCLPINSKSSLELLRDIGVFDAKGDLFELAEKNPQPLLKTLPSGTKIHIIKIERKWGLDSGPQDIEVFGTTSDGMPFLYRWGLDSHINRAPWEPSNTPARRYVDCEI
jgi:hypothetical protein